MSAQQPSGSALTREAILRALSSLSIPDIVFLIRHLGLKSPRAVLDLVAQYYPSERIPVKTQFLVEGLFEEGKI
jgi:hypothetical protein